MVAVRGRGLQSQVREAVAVPARSKTRPLRHCRYQPHPWRPVQRPSHPPERLQWTLPGRSRAIALCARHAVHRRTGPGAEWGFRPVASGTASELCSGTPLGKRSGSPSCASGPLGKERLRQQPIHPVRVGCCRVFVPSSTSPCCLGALRQSGVALLWGLLLLLRQSRPADAWVRQGLRVVVGCSPVVGRR